jgi:hypothetical protein
VHGVALYKATSSVGSVAHDPAAAVSARLPTGKLVITSCGAEKCVVLDVQKVIGAEARRRRQIKSFVVRFATFRMSWTCWKLKGLAASKAVLYVSCKTLSSSSCELKPPSMPPALLC